MSVETLYTLAIDLIQRDAGLTISKAPFDAKRLPRQIVDLSFALTVPTTADTGRERQRGQQLDETVIQITWIQKANLADPIEAEKARFRKEVEIRDVMMNCDNFPGVRIFHPRTERSNTPDGAFAVTVQTYTARHVTEFTQSDT